MITTLLNYTGRLETYIRIFGFRCVIRMSIAKLTRSSFVFKKTLPGYSHSFTMRFPSSDVKTFEQIFVHDSYKFATSSKPAVIVDAGANIGLASIYFANQYPDAKILAIEPEQCNFELLKSNVAQYANVIPIQAALWHENGEIDLVDPDRGEWGFAVRETVTDGDAANERYDVCNTVQSITVDKLMLDYGFERINLLKVDIEGSEKEMFIDSTGWLDRIDSLIIEVHDWLREGCSRTVYNGTKGFDREWRQGENIVMTRANWLEKITD